MRVDRVAADAGLAPGRLQERGQDAHGGGLARSVGPDVAEQVALGQFDGQVVYGVQVAVGFGEVLGLYHVKGERREERERDEQTKNEGGSQTVPLFSAPSPLSSLLLLPETQTDIS